ncbi:hypothetical protein CASFOL_039245 [Castilleja foliolosa]|uniref:Response regulatory domain-containing protein n=1 Tax=Castilleja foliolosa TaxID=1961234 RepID=A0ABD3BHG5_9LAMI
MPSSATISHKKKVVGMPEKVVANPFEEVRNVSALVVDDDPVTQKIHRIFLNRHGLETQVVDNGEKAVDLFMSGKTYDLVLMDLEMPVMDGQKATEKLRAMGVKSMIVGVTSCTVEEEKAAFVAAGLDDCVKKPLTSGAVIDMLDELAKRVL